MKINLALGKYTEHTDFAAEAASELFDEVRFCVGTDYDNYSCIKVSLCTVVYEIED